MPNHLAHETSPYLLQHAENPVDWYPWSSQTMQLARTQDKPILLSIGYSACHWCHVMAHESFEDADIATIMNAHFINIKVDREERPDLDQVYQNAHFLLTRRGGGWPLTMFLAPDGTPFYGGTYFPKAARYGLPSFPDLLFRVAAAYREQRTKLLTQGQQLVAALADFDAPISVSGVMLDAAPVVGAVQQLLQRFDPVQGGFGGAPKFLHPAELDLLLRQSRHDDAARHAALFTLQQMARGGLYDQLGGGFCRYSVDEFWDIPHFEKMLYDNGLLLGLYCDAWQCSGETLYARIVAQTVGWVLREMQSPIGGYYSSLDADSEHEEGKFYVWQRDTVRALLSSEEYELLQPHYGLDNPPNFESHAWHLRVSKSLDEIAVSLRLSPAQADKLLASAKAKLFEAREQRVPPGCDKKLLGSWNGLMIAGIAKAARMFARIDWLRSAQAAMDFVRNTLWQDGRLLATYKDGRTHLNAYLDDHAFLLNAALELMQSEYRSVDMAFAVKLADALLARFEDTTHGGFYFTSHDHETLIQRNRTGQDNATPSGNGIAAQALLRLTMLSGDPRYSEAAERCLKLFFPAMQQSPSQFSSMCSALTQTLHPQSLLLLYGEPQETTAWKEAVAADYRPQLMVIAVRGDEPGLPPPLRKPHMPVATAWLCHGTQCLPPQHSLDALLAKLA